MKANALLLASTFLFGGLLTVVSLSTLNKPVSAQDSDGARNKTAVHGAGVTALAVQVGGNKEFLVVIKEVPNLDPKADESMKTITSMAVYDFVAAQPNAGVATISLVGGRFMEYDLRLYEFNATKSGEKTGVNDVHERYTEYKKAMEVRAAKEAEKAAKEAAKSDKSPKSGK